MSKHSLQKKPKKLKLFRPHNYNDDPTDLFVYVEPLPQKEENRDIFYEMVKSNPKYAQYWSNNWRKTHGYPLRRKPRTNTDKIYVKPYLASEELTHRTNEIIEKLDEIFGNEQ